MQGGLPKMFDEYAKGIIDTLPRIVGLDKDECRRVLSKAYLSVLKSKMSSDQGDNDIWETRNYIRKLADTLQSVAVYDRLNGIDVPVEIETAGAFVAAESLSLLYELIPVGTDSVTLVHEDGDDGEVVEDGDVTVEEVLNDDDSDVLLHKLNYLAIEAALLYMIGGYDINAVAVARGITITDPTVELTGYSELRRIYSIEILNLIKALCLGELHNASFTPKLSIPGFNKQEMKKNLNLLYEEIRINFYAQLASAIMSYIHWLRGDDNEGLVDSLTKLNKIRNAILKNIKGMINIKYSDIYHLSSLLIAMINNTKNRSVVHSVPEPEGVDDNYRTNFNRYLRKRASGDDQKKGRPFLWPSAIDYVTDCLQGVKRDAVISMPTGSGKSFIAELAITHALHEGWVLYIAPTNALAHQIRRDLISSLASFEDIKVKAFIGGAEYTSLDNDRIDDNEKFIAVMTPEKCALALRLFPEQFVNCKLCIFDECHLLNDSNRGVTSDIMLAQLFKTSNNIRFLLMSAMVSNAAELADWLKTTNENDALPKTIKWRPSRTMRGLLLVDREKLTINAAAARKVLDEQPPTRVNQGFDTPLALLVGLSGPWTFDGPDDYKITEVPVDFPAKVRRDSEEPILESWKNTSSRLLSEVLASDGIPVINFILTSRHHAFSSAAKVQANIVNIERDQLPAVVRAFLNTADKELGVETVLWDLICKGISVHSSAMLQVEQAASEIMFNSQMTKIMFATGTLAQGLNLPALAVVIAGTSMGDPRDSDNIEGITRVNALIANAFGRASRPGFSNQGIAILVSDTPYSANITRVNPTSVLRQYTVLGEPDALVEVRSPIERFIDNVLTNDDNGMQLSNHTDLILTSLLTEYDEEDNHAGLVLSRTFGAYKSRVEFNDYNVELYRSTLNRIKDAFLEQPDVPLWMNTASMKSGVDFFRAWNFWKAYEARGIIDITTAHTLDVVGWLDVFFDVLKLLPPKFIEQYLPDDALATETVLTKMRDAIRPFRENDEFPWTAPANWDHLWNELKELVILYMNGSSYSVIAQSLLNVPAARIRNSRSSGASPIPTVFKFVREIIEPLAIDAGCFLALNEIGLFENEETPDTLKALPLCLRNGCNTLEVLSWYRTIIRQRVCAHALSNAFPTPDEGFENEDERTSWIRGKWRECLRGEHGHIQEIVNNAKLIISSSNGI